MDDDTDPLSWSQSRDCSQQLVQNVVVVVVGVGSGSGGSSGVLRGTVRVLLCRSMVVLPLFICHGRKQ